MTVELKLTVPIQAHGETVSVLQFRPMAAKHLRHAGYPFIFRMAADNKTEKVIDTSVVCLLIADLAQIPDSSVDLMAPPDWTEAMGIVLDFFAAATPAKPLPSPGTLPSSSTMLPASST